ncbi:MAG TPA: bifunctional phosphoribosyl-AMP cyclohydrolase/phosphoribosyl-ATP diphosphatase HisIE [Steroidobacteraceae bacterium]|nr:bifunctional phosphoribosyl-AMP cyclohydrolase/phosphoribosyl-ATP diphosphatase HisIE [Steroidobacteraceae bacterium]
MKLKPADIEQLAWDKQQGLLPAIVQHARSGAVLMLGYMNREALRATLSGRRVVFFSRSRQQLWMKGESSGHALELVDLRHDCDADALLVTALPKGPVCHAGTATCFGDEAVTAAERLAFLADLEGIIAERIDESPAGSYTAQLHNGGLKPMAQKVGEEGLEVALAALSEADGPLVGEAADLLFHLLVLLRARGLGVQAVIEELRRRHADRTMNAP